MSRQGILFIVAAPSGAGKTSLVNALVDTLADIRISISYTTRSKRPGDEDGVQYHFVDQADFKAMVDSDGFLEHAEVFGHYYGTGRQWVLEQLRHGTDVVLEIDWQGARQVRQNFPDSRSIFILPPSLADLKQRLTGRGQDSEQVIAARMAASRSELQHYKEFDYLVVNQKFERALDDLRYIVFAERLSLTQQLQNQAVLLAQLLQND